MTLTQQSLAESSAHQSAMTDLVRVLVVVEGANDIEFLRRISILLHSHDESLPHLVEMEQRGELVFVPFGGGHVQAWTHRLAPLGKPEFHLYDHELPPETDLRREAAEMVNRRPRCRAVLTRKRSLENYLHATAIKAAGEVDVTFGDFDPAAEVAAKSLCRRGVNETPWELLPPRARRRMANRAKRWLNTKAADHMTVDLLRERDPDGEVVSWLSTIGRLAESQ